MTSFRARYFIAVYCGDWGFQVLLLALIIYLFNILLHATNIGEALYTMLLKYVAFPASALVSGLPIACYAFKVKDGQGFLWMLRYLQPSLFVAILLWFGPEPEYGYKASSILAGLAGYIPLTVLDKLKTTESNPPCQGE